jgi:protocatechuate 3,4-dioxygenase beta subunit
VDAATGQPIRRARVAIARTTQRDAYSTITTGEEGEFEFTNLVPGRYTLTAQHHGYLTQSFNQHEQFSSAIVVGPDLDSGHLLFRLASESSISGRISDEAGEPVRDAHVYLYQSGVANGKQGTRLNRQAVADEEGLYHFGHLHPGRYFVAVMANVWYGGHSSGTTFYGGYSFSDGTSGGMIVPAQGVYPEDRGPSPLDVAYPLTFYPSATEASDASPILLKAGDRYVADLLLQPLPALRLHIQAGVAAGTDGFKTRTVVLQSRLFDGQAISVPVEQRVLDSGDMEIAGVAPGHYQLEILNHGNDGFIHSGEISASNSGEINIEHGTASIPVTATVQTAPGTALPLQGYLQLLNSRTGEALTEQLSNAGEIQFKQGIGPGKYELSFNNNSDEFIKTASASGGVLSGRTLEVKGSGPVKLNLVVARGQAQVHGVVLRDEKPWAGAMVVLVPADPAHNQMLFRRDQSDSDGTFTLVSIVPGTYTVLAIENGWDLEWLNPAVLKPYLARGEAVQVEANGKYEVKVKVQ